MKMQPLIDWRKDSLKASSPEVKQKIKLHLDQTKQQQERLRERIKVLGMGMEPISEKGRLPIPEPPQNLKMMIKNNSQIRKRSMGVIKRFDSRKS